jgi:hypothetical protein
VPLKWRVACNEDSFSVSEQPVGSDPVQSKRLLHDLRRWRIEHVGYHGRVLADRLGSHVQYRGPKTPSTLTGMLPDDPATFNVTFKYTGPVVDGPVTITGFDVVTTGNGLTLAFFSSQATENTKDNFTNGLTHQEDSFLYVPANVIPEPVPLGLIGGGLIVLAFCCKQSKPE